jgi:hypothetical protein
LLEHWLSGSDIFVPPNEFGQLSEASQYKVTSLPVPFLSYVRCAVIIYHSSCIDTILHTYIPIPAQRTPTKTVKQKAGSATIYFFAIVPVVREGMVILLADYCTSEYDEAEQLMMERARVGWLRYMNSLIARSLSAGMLSSKNYCMYGT